MDVSEKKCAHCSNPCEMKCSKCSKVGYCGVEHQKLHWKTHKKHCFPAIELSNDICGNYLASTQKILAGEIIFTEEPLIASPVVTTKAGFPICLGCSKVLPGQFGDGLNACQMCSWPLCKQDCEQISIHSRNECKIFETKMVKVQDLRSFVPLMHTIYDSIRIMRILLLKESDPEKFEKFLHLVSHEEHRVGTEEVLRTIYTLSFIHDRCSMSQTLYPVDLVNKLLGVVLHNSIQQSGRPIAPGTIREAYIYEKGSKLCHSCIPNTEIIMKGKVRQLFAVTDIEKGQMITECYGFYENYWKGIIERRHDLNVLYHFWCSCPRCSDPTELGTYFSAIKCKGKNCAGFYLPENPLSTEGQDSIWKCTSEECKNTEKYSGLSKAVAAIQNEIKEAKTLEEKLNIIQQHSNISVHENHFTLMKLRFDLIFDLDKLLSVNQPDPNHAQICSKTIEFAQKCLLIANKLTPGLNFHRGYLLYFLVQGMDKTDDSNLELMSILKALEESRRIRVEAIRILGVMPEGTDGYGFYQTLLRQEAKFKETIEMLENVLKLNEMGID